ncbi:hypothetical protein NC652_004111 [Populus alba x Populus x berolinensis]|nr:hypothetical protein NC652_004111 [Populus alba x Populus x berolinensis]
MTGHLEPDILMYMMMIKWNCLLGEESPNLDGGYGGGGNLNIGAKMGIEISDDVSGNDV